MLVIILRGVPGSGKSYFIKETIKELNLEEDQYKICSADNHFINENGEYKFVRNKIKEAHEQCYKDFMECLDKSTEEKKIVVFVDNTNTKFWEFSKYLQLGSKENKTLVVSIRLPKKSDLHTKVEEGTFLDRNTHGVPSSAVKRMYDSFQSFEKKWLKQEFNKENIFSFDINPNVFQTGFNLVLNDLNEYLLKKSED